jgi:hypothetical protein
MVRESSVVKEWKDEAERKGERKGIAKSLLAGLSARGWSVPDEVSTAINACPETSTLDGWIKAAFTSPSLEEFRKQTGL